MPQPKLSIAFGNIEDGFTFVGPFEDKDLNQLDIAEEFAERCGQFTDDYQYFQIYSPNDFYKNCIGNWVFRKDKDA